jgi:hypothetical protein
MVVELLRCVGQDRVVIIKTTVGEREMLNPFHGKEQPRNTFKKSPYLAHQCQCVFNTGTVWGTLLEIQSGEVRNIWLCDGEMSVGSVKESTQKHIRI